MYNQDWMAMLNRLTAALSGALGYTVSRDLTMALLVWSSPASSSSCSGAWSDRRGAA